MEQVGGPVIAVGVVLSAVFIPCTFLSGIVGQFFRQFALTIAVSTAISTFNSLTLSPALCALLLKPKGQGSEWRPFPGAAFGLLGAALAAMLAAGFKFWSLGLEVPAAWSERLGPHAWWAVPASAGAAGGVAGLLVFPGA